MDNPAIAAPVAAVLGLLVPLLVSLLKGQGAPAWLNQAVALAVSLAAGAATVLVDRGSLAGLSVAELLGYSGAIFAVSQSAYRLWFAATPLNARLEALVFGSPATGPALAGIVAGLVSALALGP